MNKGVSNIILFIWIVVLLFACSHTREHGNSHHTKQNIEPQVKNKTTIGNKIASLAQSQLGAPYRYGGASPNGFDCSGLVYYTHKQIGIPTPRTSHAQFNFAQPVKINLLESGDVIFFKINRQKISHVGIYVGNGQFIHAPTSGKMVSMNYLNDPYWSSRIISGGRLY